MWRQCLPTVRVAGGGNARIASYRAHTIACSALLRTHGPKTSLPRQKVTPECSPCLQDNSSTDLHGAYTAVVVNTVTNPHDMSTPGRESSSNLYESEHFETASMNPAPGLPLFPAHDVVHARAQAPSEPILSTSQEDARIPVPDTSTKDAVVGDEAASATRLLEMLSASATKEPPNVVRSLYYAVSARGQLSMLDSAHFTTLLRFFGTLSLSSPEKVYTYKYSHSIASDLPSQAFRPYWSFMVAVGIDKVSMGFKHNMVDHYWLLRAQLSLLDVACRSSTRSTRQRSWLQTKFRVVQHHYRLLNASIHNDPSSHRIYHVSYLGFLLAHGIPEYRKEAVKTISCLILNYDDCPPWLLSYLWNIVLKVEELPAELKIHILNALEARVTSALVVTYASPDEPRREDIKMPLPKLTFVQRSKAALSDIPTHQSLPKRSPGANVGLSISRPPTVKPPKPIFTSVLVNYLGQALFTRHSPCDKADALETEFKDWALSIASAIFVGKGGMTPDRRWTSLYLLALARTSSPSGKPPNEPILVESGAVAEWHTICALASIEKLVLSTGEQVTLPFTDVVTQGFNHILNSLWRSWVSARTDLTVRRLVTMRAICASFYHLGGRLGNKHLVEDCHRFTITSGILDPHPVDSSSPIGLHTLAVEQFVSCVNSGFQVSDAYHDMKKALPDQHSLTVVVNSVVDRLTWQAPHMAHYVHKFAAENYGLRLYVANAAKLALAFARKGYKDALSYLELDYFNDKELLQIVLPLLTYYAQLGQRLGRQRASIVGRAMLAAFQVRPPREAREDIQRIVLTLPRLGSNLAETAVEVVEAILRKAPSYFCRYFYSAFLRRLLAHREFACAKRVFDIACRKWPRFQRSWQDFLISEYIRAGALTFTRKLARSRFNRSRTDSSHLVLLARRISTHKHTLRKVATLSMQAIATRSELSNRALGCLHTLNLLLRANRKRAALKFYVQMRSSFTVKEQTGMGNAIIYASGAWQRNERRLRCLFGTMDRLITSYGFIPDRVTVNILLSALMQWQKGVDKFVLRDLFDRLVQSGYPAGRWNCPPFGSRKRKPGDVAMVKEGVSEQVAGMFELPIMREDISFRRHVQPLYRTFIGHFHLRGDKASARVVKGILKELEERMEEDGENGTRDESGRRSNGEA
ncbi:hypothetical protein OBBRIDRAFT_884778 [Obba rivulosa]|uniref:Uncharacterized protein n=1 Tax=Obba rivulosa TaxID=1052685 RepID=A0A8E2J6J6_9APHY|nr:hypothetical protein OBBRIDRAFT_884778 [Obba rivulosa]